jgi:hypothetical protein
MAANEETDLKKKKKKRGMAKYTRARTKQKRRSLEDREWVLARHLPHPKLEVIVEHKIEQWYYKRPPLSIKTDAALHRDTLMLFAHSGCLPAA